MSDRGTRNNSWVVTPSQTVGPFFAYCLTPRAYRRDDLVTNEMFANDTVGQRIVIEGVVLDGHERLVPDAMLEFWQADSQGRFAQSSGADRFRGFGRAECDREGRYRVSTIKPGSVAGEDGLLSAPHINVSIFAKGLQRQLFTRIYFEGESGNETDRVLASVPRQYRDTLIARPVDGDAARLRFDVRLRGRAETVFFEA